jgi:NAD(P)H-dependent flavin oxidoreductase YrpB (nitropropane dioxygenase family)
MPYQGMIASPVLAAANRAQRGDINPGFAGQGIGMVKAVRPAAEILREMVYSAEQALQRASNLHR